MPSSGFGGGSSSGSGGGVTTEDLEKIFGMKLEPGEFVDSSYRGNFVYDGLDDSSGASFSAFAIAVPFLPLCPIDFDAIGIDVASAIANSSCRLAMYDSAGASGKPKNLIKDAGIADTATTGEKILEFGQNQTLDELSWLIYATNKSSLSIMCLLDAANEGDIGSMDVGRTSFSSTRRKCYAINFSLGPVGSEIPFPLDIESSISLLSSNILPRIFLRKA